MHWEILLMITAFRDVILHSGAIPALVQLIEDHLTKLPSTTLLPNESFTTICHASWTIAQLCKGTPLPEITFLRPAFPTLMKLFHHNRIDTLTNVSWAFVSIAKVDIHAIQPLIRQFVALLTRPLLILQAAAMQIIGQLVTADHRIIQDVIDAGGLAQFRVCLLHGKKEIVSESCRILCKLANGTEEQRHVIISEDIFLALSHLLYTETEDMIVIKEVIEVMEMIIRKSSPELTLRILDEEMTMNAFRCAIFTISDVSLLHQILQIVERIFQVAHTMSVLQIVIEIMNTDEEMMNQINRLRFYHHSDKIRCIAQKIFMLM
jgi:hypothetical protein